MSKISNRNCCVSKCHSRASRDPKISFHGFPNENETVLVNGESVSRRNMWIKILRIDKTVQKYMLVCSKHFLKSDYILPGVKTIKPRLKKIALPSQNIPEPCTIDLPKSHPETNRTKDFVDGKKKLKYHAIPVLRLGHGKTEFGSDEEFACNSDSDPDIIEIKKISAAESKRDATVNIEIDPPDIKTEIKEEPQLEMEIDTGRRPSRRAAQVAAKKIYNTVHNLGGIESDLSSCTPSRSGGSRSFQRQRQRFTPLKFNGPELDVVLECNEEILSEVQAEALLKSQLEYNMVMKTLRSLKASNVKIICHMADDQPAEIIEPAVALSPLNITIQNGTPVVQNLRKSPNIIAITPVRPESSSILPMEP
ncbi:uncharacterized protein LOC129226126 [Uloborus diversus]|uniref:uncharacterized protein LOC129226126 n=1 Tax=Uloborus diversus TaxID=327109 RepID=UPI0024094963|nr:uncharacterized protein LOC129226126 [Uloborus diversus]